MSNDNNPFNILGSQSTPPSAGEEKQINEQDVNKRIEAIITSGDVVLFMKGNANFPQCGFSANAIGILNNIGKEYLTYDILKDPELRQALKEYSNWPTFPQLYFKGKLIGGNDIMMEMFEDGDLQELMNS